MLDQDQKTLVDGCKDNLCVMWTTLETTYRQKKAGSRFNAYDDLFSIRKSDDESLQSLINRVDESMKLIDDWCVYLLTPVNVLQLTLENLIETPRPFYAFVSLCLLHQAQFEDNDRHEICLFPELGLALKLLVL